MSASVMKMPTGQLIMSRIIYFSDMQHSDRPEIPVGVAAEATLNTLCAIGVALRPGFTAAELALMGPIARSQLESPISTLWPELRAIFESTAPGCALKTFAECHAGSLSVFTPVQMQVPRQWLLQPDPNKLKTIVVDRMKVAMVDAYYEQLFPARNGVVEDPTVEEASHKAA